VNALSLIKDVEDVEGAVVRHKEVLVLRLQPLEVHLPAREAKESGRSEA